MRHTSWKYPKAGGYRILPELNIACSGLAISAKKEDWISLSGNNTNLRLALEELYELFKHAPVLGSLINPEVSVKKDILFNLKWEDIRPILNKALTDEIDGDKVEMGVVAQGLAKAAKLLVSKYNLVFTNVPYLTQKKQQKILYDYSYKNHPESKYDLATVFLERCINFCTKDGTCSIVLPQNWMFLASYKRFRETLLRKRQWNCVVRLGPGAFETISGEVVKATLVELSKSEPIKGHCFSVLDVSNINTVQEKAERLKNNNLITLKQNDQLKNPDSRIVFESDYRTSLLSKYAISMRGIVSGDNEKWGRKYWELAKLGKRWKPLQSTPPLKSHFFGKENVIDWITEGNGMLRPGTTNEAYGRNGVAVKQVGNLSATLYDGSLYDNNTGTIVPHKKEYLPAMWCFCSSSEYNDAVRRIDQKLNVTNATLIKVPFDFAVWDKIAQDKYPNGLPKPYSNDPAQWIFHGHPCGSVVWDDKEKWTTYGPLRSGDTVLQVAVARLLGYRWPAELDKNMELGDEQREWVIRCEALLPYADEDGIVCIPPVRGELSAADRLMNLLAAAYSDTWSGDIQAQLLKSVDHGGKTLETWLRDKFFTQHCKLFHHRPFLWHIWDGLRDGFAALVNYHKLNHKNLETLIYTYLGDWINRQTQDVGNGVDGAVERLSASKFLKKKLELILEGEVPHDIFVRWKPIEKQPIGWNPDLNDGVRINIRPFMAVDDVRKRGAGVLRDKPNIKWSKDRGKDVESAPWYHLFKGDRISDHHLTIEEKRAARKTVN